MKRTAVVSIGRNVGGEPMKPVLWHDFKAETLAACLRHGTVIFKSDEYADGHGMWEGQVEPSSVFIVLLRDDFAHDHLRATLIEIRKTSRQDAIGFVVAESWENVL